MESLWHGWRWICHRISATGVSSQTRDTYASAVPEHTVGFLKVYYDNEMLKKEIAAIFERYISAKPDGNNIIECWFRLRALALSFKNPAFREEDEWRVCYSPIITTHLEKRDLEIMVLLLSLGYRTASMRRSSASYR